MKLAIIDGYSVLNRAFHALPLLTTQRGVPTNAVYGFLLTFLKFAEEEQPSHVLVALDRPGRTFRHERFEAYKGQRAEPDERFIRQVPLFEAVLEALGIPHYGQSGVEADDIIGSLARRAAEEGVPTVILTGDRDLLQLVRPGVEVVLARGVDRLVRYDTEAVYRDLGVYPQQVPDLKAIMGDASDNIPGVRGIGSKGAQALLAGGRRLEELLERPESIREERLRKRLLAERQQAMLSKELAVIRTDVPIPLAWEELRFALDRGPRARELFEELEFRSLAERLGLAPARTFRAASEVAEWSGVAVWWEEDELFLYDGRHLTVGGWEDLRQRLEAPGEKCVFDVKRFLRRAWRASIRPEGPFFDPLLAGYLLYPLSERYTLSELARRYLGAAPAEGGKAAAEVLYALRPALKAEVEGNQLWSLFAQVELPLARVLAQMEENGIRVDAAVLRAMGEELATEMAEVEEEIYRTAGTTFNINSTPQLRRVLFEELKLPVLKRTKTGPSTDAEVLEQLASEHAVVALILRYRQLQKLKSTYIDGLIPLIGPDGRVHTTFHQTVASTGRLSSSDPNLQNIPIRLELGRRLRRAFVPSDGCLLLAADYSQIELRVLAHLSGDEHLCEAFRSRQDIHTQTAAEVFGIPPEAVGPEERRRAKAVNFGIVYGISDFGLARDLGISVTEARAIIERYFQRFPKVRAYLDAQIAFARQHGYVETMLGRRRPLPDIHHRNRAARSFAERTAMNTPIQGSAADLIKLAMVQLFQRLEERGMERRLLLQVHDELILEAPEAQVEATGQLLGEVMAKAYPLSVPIEVELKVGTSWYDVEPVAVFA